MHFLFRYKKDGLPLGLIKLHEFLLEDTIGYFEKNRSIRKKIKEARKTIKKALRFGKKKKIYPNEKTDRAVDLMAELQEEVDYTHQVLKKSAVELEELIVHIMGERVATVSNHIERAREHFRKNDLEKGRGLLMEAQNQLGNKLLEKTRKSFLTGIDSEIKKLKREIKSKQPKPK